MTEDVKMATVPTQEEKKADEAAPAHLQIDEEFKAFTPEEKKTK
jgi:hypothetical protein